MVDCNFDGKNLAGWFGVVWVSTSEKQNYFLFSATGPKSNNTHDNHNFSTDDSSWLILCCKVSSLWFWRELRSRYKRTFNVHVRLYLSFDVFDARNKSVLLIYIKNFWEIQSINWGLDRTILAIGYGEDWKNKSLNNKIVFVFLVTLAHEYFEAIKRTISSLIIFFHSLKVVDWELDGRSLAAFPGKKSASFNQALLKATSIILRQPDFHVKKQLDSKRNKRTSSKKGCRLKPCWG